MRRMAAIVAAATLAATLAGALLAAGPAVSGTGDPQEASAGSPVVHHYEYVFLPGEFYVYDMDNEQQLVQHVIGLATTEPRGVIVDPATHIMFISYGGYGPADPEQISSELNGSVMAYDMVSEEVKWNEKYPFGVDSGAITPDGSKIYMPTGENDESGIWKILSPATGAVEGEIHGGKGAHNTIVSLDGRYVFLGGRSGEYLEAASTATGAIVSRMGPLLGKGVRPFTVNGADTLAYTTASEHLGFQVSSVATGKVLFTDEFTELPQIPLPYELTYSAPSHGISLTPDETRLFVFDAFHETVHVFDTSGAHAAAPVPIAVVKLSARGGKQNPCTSDCEKSGWLQASLDGRFVYVGDTGDVLDAHTLSIVKTLEPMANTRVMVEVDWANGVPVATSSRYGLGYVRPPGSGGGTPEVSAPAMTLGSLSSLSAVSPLPQQPAIGALRLTPSAFRAAGIRSDPRRGRARTGAVVSYTDTLGGEATFTVLIRTAGIRVAGGRCAVLRRGTVARGPRRCNRYVALARFVRHDRAGTNRFRFDGWIGRTRLRAGHYRLVVLARPGTIAGPSAGFRVLG